MLQAKDLKLTTDNWSSYCRGHGLIMLKGTTAQTFGLESTYRYLKL